MLGKNKLFIYLFLFIFIFWSLSPTGKEKKKFQFLVFNPQDPRAPRASWVKPREEEGFSA
jgi:hypothetical protein